MDQQLIESQEHSPFPTKSKGKPTLIKKRLK